MLLPLLVVGILISPATRSQEILPRFSVNRLSDNKVLIQWKNPDTSLRQLSIQQSPDSINGFRTVLTIPDPRLEQNGSVIDRPQAAKMYYRVYLMYPRGRYQFSKSQLPASLPPPTPPAQPIQNPTPPVPGKTTIDQRFSADSVKLKKIPEPNTPPKTPPPTPVIKPQIESLPDLKPGQKVEIKKANEVPTEPDTYTPSLHVYTHRDGYPFIQLPGTWDLSKTRIRFLQEDGKILFEITSPPLFSFRIDKTNFHRSGWYAFELWHKGKLVEKNKLYLPLEF